MREPTEAMLAIFERAYRNSVAFQEDRLLGPDLVHEVRPVLETLAESTQPEKGELSCHEAYALLTLLGRRAGQLGATPTAALALLRAMVLALREAGSEMAEAFHEELQLVLLEGYCAGRDERTMSDLQASVARGQLSFNLAPRCRYVALAGPLEGDALEQVLDERAREFLREDGVACLLDVSRLECMPPEHVARALLEFCLACRSVGGSVILIGVAGELLTHLRGLGLSDATAQVVDGFGRGMALVLELAGYELRPQRGRWTKALFARR